MAQGDVFKKPYVDEREKNNLEGLLEQLNLPPGAIAFVKRNKRLIQVAVAVVVMVAIVWALYGSYRENRIQNASMALAAAVEHDGQALIDALAAVEADYRGTDLAAWAKITRAHELAASDQVAEARQTYREALEKAGRSSPVRPLLVYGIAQTSAVLEEYEQAAAQYEALKTMQGFAEIGYLGMGQIHELQGAPAKAIQVYEEYLSTIAISGSPGQRALVEEKIARIKATL